MFLQKVRRMDFVHSRDRTQKSMTTQKVEVQSLQGLPCNNACECGARSSTKKHARRVS